MNEMIYDAILFKFCATEAKKICQAKIKSLWTFVVKSSTCSAADSLTHSTSDKDRDGG